MFCFACSLHAGQPHEVFLQKVQGFGAMANVLAFAFWRANKVQPLAQAMSVTMY